MKKMMLWSGILIFAMGFGGAANAIEVSHNHKVSSKVFEHAVKGFNTKMQLHANHSRHEKLTPVAWIFNNDSYGEHQEHAPRGKGPLAFAHLRVRKLVEVGSHTHIAAVPEPEVYAMFLAGLGIVGAFARRRRSS